MTPSTRLEVVRWVEERWGDARFTELAGDASTRRFYRVERRGQPACVLMDYGRSFVGETDDVRLNRVFSDASLPVAAVLEVLPNPGCLLLEDLGDTTLERALQEDREGASRDVPRLLRDAVELAAAIAVRGTPVLAASDRAEGPTLDASRFRFEMDFFCTHFAGGFRSCRPLPGTLVDELHRLAARAAETPHAVLCHRDFHCRNLMVRDDGSLAMVDIQDARWGPDSYDLASLLRDAYQDMEPGWTEALTGAFLSSLPDPPDAEAFRHRLDIVSAQRMIKALGTFGYQITRMGNSRYMAAIPRTVTRLDGLLPRLDETARLHGLMTEAALLELPR